MIILPFTKLFVVIPPLNEKGKDFYDARAEREHIMSLVGKKVEIDSISGIKLHEGPTSSTLTIRFDAEDTVTTLFADYFAGDLVVGIEDWNDHLVVPATDVPAGESNE